VSSQTERDIIKTALEHPGLLSRIELEFVVRLGKLPARQGLSVREASWLHDIGRKKLGMSVGAPAPRTIIDYRGRVCA
jgi:hypothetical protein